MLCKLLVLCSVAACTLQAQPYSRQIGGISVRTDVLLDQPFTGGVDNPRHQFVDIDGDGDLDLFVYDNDGSMSFYRNSGSAQTFIFAYCAHCVSIPEFAYWFVFADLNSDGKPDLCTDDSSSGVRVHLNTGSAQSPEFTLTSPTLLDSSGTPILGAPIGAPTFADMNGDSLLDYVSSNISGSFNYYENVGTPANPLFRFVTDTFQNIVILGDTCPSPVSMPTPFDVSHHGGGNLQFADIDANGTPDMFYGDLFSHGIFFMRNDGTPSAPALHCVTNRYPDQFLVTSGFNQPSLADIDGDGRLDLFAAVLNASPRHNFWYYKNGGTTTIANFVLQTRDFLQSLDVGGSAHPAFVDVDGNGTLDLVVGTLDGKMWLFTNTGTTTSPSFELADTMFAGITGNFTYAPAFIDIDKDGDQDLFIGRFDGRIKFYRNVGTPGSPVFVAESAATDTINVGRNASPAFTDIDGDGDADLFVGKANGTISFYRNIGTDSNFVPLLAGPAYGGIDVGEDAAPAFELNSAHHLHDLYIGNAEGRLSYYENVGDSTLAQYQYRTDFAGILDPMRESAPVFVDLDGDGDRDIFIGTSKGGIHYYRNDLLTGVEPVIDARPQMFELLQNYPNPFNPVTNFEFRLKVGQSPSPHDGVVKLSIFTMLGEEVVTLTKRAGEPGLYKLSWDASGVPAGVYYYRLTAGREMITRKMVLVK